MGVGESKKPEVCSKIIEALDLLPAENLSIALEEVLKTVEKPENLFSLKIPADQSIKAISALVPIIHQKALQVNARLKENESPDISTEGLAVKIFMLYKALLASLCKPLILSQYLWHIDQEKKEVPIIIRLAESLSVLLFVHGMTTQFYDLPPPVSPLDLDKRIMWKPAKAYGKLWNDSLRERCTILMIFLFLAYFSKGPYVQQNALLGMVGNRLWKNCETILRSIEYIVIEADEDDFDLRKQEGFVKLRCIALNFLLLCISNRVSNKFAEAEISQLYITQKAAQLKYKLGIEVDEKTQLLSSNYAVEYVSSNFAGFFATFQKSLRTAVQLLVIDKEISTDYFDLALRGAVFCLNLFNLNPAMFQKEPSSILIDIIADLSTLMLYTNEDLTQDTITVFALLISIFSTDRNVCVEMSKLFTGAYALTVFNDFKGTYADYYIRCCKEVLTTNPGYRPYDVLLIFPLYSILPYVHSMEVTSGRILCEILVRLGSTSMLENSISSVQALTLLCHGIRLNVQCTMDESSWVLSSILSEPTALEVLSIALEEDDEKELQKQLLGKLKEYEVRITMGNRGEDETESPIVELHDGPVEGKPSPLPKQFLISAKAKEQHKTPITVSLLNPKDEPRPFITGIDHHEGKFFISSLKENLIKPYTKWKQVHAPDTKEYSLRVLSEYLKQTTIVDLFNPAVPAEFNCELTADTLRWICEVVNEISEKKYISYFI